MNVYLFLSNDKEIAESFKFSETGLVAFWCRYMRLTNYIEGNRGLFAVGKWIKLKKVNNECNCISCNYFDLAKYVYFAEEVLETDGAFLMCLGLEIMTGIIYRLINDMPSLGDSSVISIAGVLLNYQFIGIDYTAKVERYGYSFAHSMLKLGGATCYCDGQAKHMVKLSRITPNAYFLVDCIHA